jgi:hypothetical protein
MTKTSVSSILGKAKVAKKTKTAAGKEKNMYPATNATKKLAQRLLDTSKEAENLRAELSVMHADVEALVHEKRLEDVKNNNYWQSCHLEATDGDLVRCTFTNKFSKVPDEDVEALKELCKKNDLNYEELFKEDENLAMKAGILADKKNVEILHEKLGEELFLEMFEYTTEVKPGEEFDRKQFQIKEDLREEVLSFTKQAKATIVVK